MNVVSQRWLEESVKAGRRMPEHRFGVVAGPDAGMAAAQPQLPRGAQAGDVAHSALGAGAGSQRAAEDAAGAAAPAGMPSGYSIVP